MSELEEFLFLVENRRVNEEGEVVELSHIFKGAVEAGSLWVVVNV